jgi:hypothetical protein
MIILKAKHNLATAASSLQFSVPLSASIRLKAIYLMAGRVELGLSIPDRSICATAPRNR